jgi:endoglucanase
MLSRRVTTAFALIVGVALVASCSRDREPPPAPRPALDETPWIAWTERFVEPSGRVVDDGQNGISHSEGQAYAMILATAFDDRETFDEVWSWAQRELRGRDDRLLSWRWEPDADGASGGAVTDVNNATDADVLAAWALLRAAERWDDPALRDEGLGLANEVARLLSRDTDSGRVLLPGAQGFEKPEGPIVNLSYWIFPAFERFAIETDDPRWREIAETGARLVERARFGDATLPPDWLQIGEELRPAPLFPPRSGYDAVRIPLYLAWAKRAQPALIEPYARVWAAHAEDSAAPLPAWIDLATGESGEPAPRGFHAVRALCTGRDDADALARPAPRAGERYYSATLALLAHVAAHETSAL